MSYGRKYVIRHRLRRRVNRFAPEAYNSAAQAITGARFRQVVSAVTWYPIPDRKVVIVFYAKSDSNVVSYIKDVLIKNGVTPKKTNQKNKKVEFTFSDATQGQRAMDIINKMRGDSLLLTKIDFSGSIPVGTSENGLKVPLSGYTQEQRENNDGGYNPFKKQSTGDAEGGTGFNATWLIIGGIAVAAALAIVVILKKKK